jgi:peptide chain release factor 1
MFERLDQIEIRYEELTRALLSPEITNDSAKYQKTAKAHSEVAGIVEKYREYKDLKRGIAESRAVLVDETDPEMRAYAEEELTKLEARIVGVEEDLKVLLLPKDPNDEKNVVLEIRAGTGGDEATLFVAEVFRMYNRYAETQKWKVEVLSTSESGVGGLKEVIALIEGDRVYSRLKYESGVHRVQRVPATEQQGRVHTSAITVAVLPEAEEVDVKIEAKDLRIDTFCSSGPGGQSVRMRSRRSRTGKKACACCARGCTKSRCRSSRTRWRKNVGRWWGRATARRRFAPTIFRRTGLRIIALASRFTSLSR